MSLNDKDNRCSGRSARRAYTSAEPLDSFANNTCVGSSTKVSVIIPAYLAEHSLAATLRSVFAQTLPASEVIVINDGSPDATREVAHSYGDQITYIEQANAGQGAARNRGLERATGDFVAFLDADDCWLPTFLHRCVSFLNRFPEAVAVSTGCVITLRNGREKILPARLKEEPPWREGMLESFFEVWAAQDHVRTGSNLIRRSVIMHAGFQRSDLRMSQDLEYWGYIATFGKWGFIPEPLWIGNSGAASRESGWMRKYRERRRFCPTVESWQQRIVPRLRPSELLHFKSVRGRVALGYAHAKILAGDSNGALIIIRAYGAEMPRNTMAGLLRCGARFGWLGWLSVCNVVRCKEILKAM